MNNRYLYRAKRTDNGEWVEGNLIHAKKDYYICKNPYECMDEYSSLNGQSYGFGDFKFVDPSTICQCTGLKDKNGRLIWENDIVDFLGHEGAVKYECGSFGIAYRECIDWEKIEANICRITGCDNALYACENDNYISLWEIYWNFNDEDNCLSTVEVIGMMKGKKVVMNGKYHVSEKNKGKVFEVASDPYSVCGTVVVKLIGLAGCYALDGLTEVVE